MTIVHEVSGYRCYVGRIFIQNIQAYPNKKNMTSS